MIGTLKVRRCLHHDAASDRTILQEDPAAVEKAKAERKAKEEAKAKAGGNMPIIAAILVVIIAIVYLYMQ